MGVGMPEYLLLFRKPPTDTSNSYADNPGGEEQAALHAIALADRCARLQRSSGDRLLSPAELEGLSHAQIFKLFRDYSLSDVYNFEHHVTIGEALETSGVAGHLHAAAAAIVER
jgi:hypothetical protein